MTRRIARSPRGPIWLLAWLLVLRTAMPFLASASADLQGVALNEVCSVHGVALAPQDRREPLQGSADHGGAHHCALGALGAVCAPSATPGLGALGPAVAGASNTTVLPVPWPDAAARWVARNKHGPPEPA